MSGTTSGIEIAVIGMAGRFPGAKNLDQFWQNLCAGVESIKFFTDEELLGLEPLLDAEGGFSLAREHRTEGAELSSPAQNAINEEAVDDYAKPVG